MTLPTAPTYTQRLAYGKGGSPLPDTWVDLDDVIQPMVAQAQPQTLASDAPKKRTVRKQRAAEPQPASNAQQPEQAPLTPVTPSADKTERTELALADTSTLNRYAERQSQSQDQQKFRGGDAIVIGASTLVIVLLVVLLLVLLL